MTILALDYEFKIKEIPINYKDRIEGSNSKLNTYKDGFKVLKTIFILFKDFKPFEFFSFLAAIFLFCFLALFVPVFIEFIKTGLVPRFPSLIMSICFAIFSISFFNLGIVLSVIIKNSKRSRKQFLLNYKDN